jgi:YidC/Oxa1 family membrane protein insertase
MQPKVAELQKKYARDRQKMAREQMKLYKESGVSPAGCVLPMLLQLPIWIALFHSISRVLAVIPEDFLRLSQYLYSWPMIYSKLPLENQFLWLNLAAPDSRLVLPILVGGTMWLQQKMITSENADPQQKSQSQMMLWVMPLMFGMLTLSFPSGLALYWVTSNTISIIIQYFISGWGGLSNLTINFKRPQIIDRKPTKTIPPAKSETGNEEEEESDGEHRSNRQDRGGSNPRRPRTARRQPKRSKSDDIKRK